MTIEDLLEADNNSRINLYLDDWQMNKPIFSGFSKEIPYIYYPYRIDYITITINDLRAELVLEISSPQREMFPSIKELKGYNIDIILFEIGQRPILFTCRNKDNNILLCVRCKSNICETIWLLSEVDPKILIDLLQNKISIRGAFTNENKNKYTVIRDDRDIYLAYKELHEIIWSKTSQYLPDAGEYMDADDGEFYEEIRHYNYFVSKE